MNQLPISESDIRLIEEKIGRGLSNEEKNVFSIYLNQNNDAYAITCGFNKATELQINNENIQITAKHICEPDILTVRTNMMQNFYQLLLSGSAPIAQSFTYLGNNHAIINDIANTGNNTLIPFVHHTLRSTNETEYFFHFNLGIHHNLFLPFSKTKKYKIILIKPIKEISSNNNPLFYSFIEPFYKKSLNDKIITACSLPYHNGICGAILDIFLKAKCNINVDASLFSPHVDGNNNYPACLLIICEENNIAQLKENATFYGFNSIEIGSISEGKDLSIVNQETQVVVLKQSIFADIKPQPIIKTQNNQTNSNSTLANKTKDNNYKKTIAKLIEYECKQRHQHFEEFDRMSGITNISANYFSDAALIRFKNSNAALAFAIQAININDTNSCKTNIQQAFSIANRKIAASGAKPEKIILFCNETTNAEILSIADKTAKKLNIELIKQNTIQNNQGSIIWVMALGVVPNRYHLMTQGLKEKGDMIFLIGKYHDKLTFSPNLQSIYQLQNNIGETNLEYEAKLCETTFELIKKNLVRSSNSVKSGGTVLTLVESAMVNHLGFDVTSLAEISKDVFLFSETPGKVIVSVTPDKEDQFIDFMISKNFPFIALGHVTKEEFRIDDISYGFVMDIKSACYQ
jgi:selenophosphate synthetase-related protein